MENIKNIGERVKTRGPTPCPRGWAARPLPLGVPLPRGPPGAPLTSTPLYIFGFAEEKIGEKVSSLKDRGCRLEGGE